MKGGFGKAKASFYFAKATVISMNDTSSWKIISNCKLLCRVGEKYIYYRKGVLYSGDSDGNGMTCLLTLPSTPVKKSIIKSRALERVARLEPRLAVALNETEFLLSYQGRIIRINLNGTMQVEHNYCPTMNNPISFCVVGSRIIYGEYCGNSNRTEVSVYERFNNGEWKNVFTFPAGKIQHIHQICYDEYRDYFWVLTGDQNNECALWRMNTDYSDAVPVFSGEQKYRSCFIMPRPDGIAYATDTPLEQNSIYFSRAQNDLSWSVPEAIFEMPGPCIYGTKLQDGRFIMATSVEPDASLPTYRYRITRKLGKGVRDRNTYLICGNQNGEFEEIARFKKDPLNMWLFQFGNILFPNIGNTNRILCTGQALRGIDGKTIEVF